MSLPNRASSTSEFDYLTNIECRSNGSQNHELEWICQTANQKHSENVRLRERLQTQKESHEQFVRQTAVEMETLRRQLRAAQERLGQEQLQSRRWFQRSEQFRERAERAEWQMAERLGYAEKREADHQRRSRLVNSLNVISPGEITESASANAFSDSHAKPSKGSQGSASRRQRPATVAVSEAGNVRFSLRTGQARVVHRDTDNQFLQVRKQLSRLNVI